MSALKHENELEHLDPCICTKNYVTGYVLDYDCGREIASRRSLCPGCGVPWESHVGSCYGT
jgi:hypothetical protein